MRNILYLLFLILGSNLVTACIDEEFTTNPNDRLTFSADTVRFDTVFTAIGSSTTRFMAYNRNKKAISIESIHLKNGDKSGFRINVDGMKGNYFEQIDVSKNDSLYMFIEVTVDPTGSDLPERREDILEFTYNGIRQEIVLEAYGQDAILWRGKRIEVDTLLTATKPFLIYDSLYVASGRTLTLMEGTRLFMHDKARIIVEGKLVSQGSLGQPVVIRGDRTDKLFNNLAYDQMAGQWGGIIVKTESYENILTHTHIRGTAFGIRIDSAATDREKIRLESCILKNSNQSLLAAVNSRIECSNSEFSNAGSALVSVQGGAYRFTHCTMVNYYPFGVIDNATVYLSNYKFDDAGNRVMLPLEQADFNNTIIWGKRSVEVNLDEYQSAASEATAFAHRFDHCLIKANGEDDENFINTVWNKDPLFRDIEEKEYRFDFALTAESPACGAANTNWGAQFPYDIEGNPRSEARVDIGARQFIETNESE